MSRTLSMYIGGNKLHLFVCLVINCQIVRINIMSILGVFPGRPTGNKDSVVLTGYDVIRETGVRTGLCEESVVIPNSSLPPGRWRYMYCLG